MRLSCPSCESEYEIDASVIGEKGRMVRCAHCSGEWFQAPEDTAAPAPAAQPAPTESAAAPAPADPPAKEWATPEFRISGSAPAARVAAAGLAQDETAAERPVVETGEHAGDQTPDRSLRIHYDEPPTVEPSFPAVEEPYAALPEGRDTGALTASLRDDSPPPSRTGASFFGGFATTAVLVGLCAGVYLTTPQIVQAVPALEPALSTYVEWVDKGRVALQVIASGQ